MLRQGDMPSEIVLMVVCNHYPVTDKLESSICPLVVLEILADQCLWVEYRCRFPLNLPSSRLSERSS
jgi:hypothetical protein